MLSLNIRNEEVCFRNVRPGHLPDLLKWYNMVEDFMFATGVDQPITIELLEQKYTEAASQMNEFFVGIYTCCENRLVGILRGKLQSRSREGVWIHSIAIHPDYRMKGYGRASIILLLQYLKKTYNTKNAYLAVLEENYGGRAFWNKHDFRVMRKMENYIRLREKQRNVIIMRRAL